MTSDMVKKFAFDKVFTRRRKRSSSTAVKDPDFVLPGLRRDEMPKHRSCKVHLLSKIYGKEASRKQAVQIEEEYGTAYCFFNDIHHGLRSRKNNDADPSPAPLQGTNTSSDPVPLEANDISSSPGSLEATYTSSISVPFQAENMSSGSFSDHLERVWSSFPTEKLVDVTYLECVWFGLYRQASQKNKVLSWIKKKNIFSKNYVFVPICCWSHWNLLILCHFGEPLDSDNKRPCMLLLDSLHLAGPKRLESEIRKFILDIYNAEGRSDGRAARIPLLIPKVPQQRNKECGFFSLYFIKKFMEASPETVSESGVPFIHQNWFDRRELDSFCIALEKESQEQSRLEATTTENTVQHESWKDGDVIVIND